MFKGLGDLGRLIQMAQQQAQNVQENMEKKKQELAHRRVQGSAGGGMVTVVANGNREIVEVKIDRQAIGDDLDLLEGLFMAAANDALHKAENLQREEMTDVIGNMTDQFGGLQGLLKLLANSDKSS